jgi:hypothetical protein
VSNFPVFSNIIQIIGKTIFKKLIIRQKKSLLKNIEKGFLKRAILLAIDSCNYLRNCSVVVVIVGVGSDIVLGNDNLAVNALVIAWLVSANPFAVHVSCRKDFLDLSSQDTFCSWCCFNGSAVDCIHV